MKYYRYILVLLATLSCACSDWLDVHPKSRVLAGDHFETEQGYADQLTGVYTRMTSTALYGRELTFGLREALSQNYDLDVASSYARAALYEYADEGVKAKITNAWAESYTAIANLNLMLEYMETVNPAKFSGVNYNVYKGEALGLRAFLHFELLRMFAPAPAATPNAPAIPYVTTYSTLVTPLSTVSQALDLVIADLTAAIECLKSDKLYTAEDATEAYQARNERASRFNYYAAHATLARVYLWKGDAGNARTHAEEVIESERFAWAHYTSIMASNITERDLVYKGEHIFRLNINKLVDVVKPYFTASSGTEKLSPSETKMDNIFEVSSAALGMDYRYTYHYAYDGGERYLAKFWQPEGGTYTDMMPLIRLSEMYYIVAEALATSDPAQAVELLNTVRGQRGLSNYPLSETLSTAAVQEEIYKEYRKETLGEGQLFYYYKRLNLNIIPGSSKPGNNAAYVFPLPDNEIEFGNR
ncbi:MAG: RagB/SusD family nutrient uptake outer membrane protein [Odoribacteraceae bacterium]|jgi:hypothetical protein|nr:RagB/SusD family nutrient uptake outer membrane protein [Odoribacteraceae bacterium]